MVYRVPQKKKKALWRLLGSLRHIYLAVLVHHLGGHGTFAGVVSWIMFPHPKDSADPNH